MPIMFSSHNGILIEIKTKMFSGNSQILKTKYTSNNLKEESIK